MEIYTEKKQKSNSSIYSFLEIKQSGYRNKKYNKKKEGGGIIKFS
jgi:hypothetical protein